MNKQLRIAYCIPSLYYPSGMERALTLKANYFAEHFGYDIHIILTDGKGKEPYYPLHPSITLHQLSINYDEMYGHSLLKRISGYSKKQRLYKKRLNECLCEIRPDITVSLLRREINFICEMKDGSVKLGEIHFNKSNYRAFNDNRLPGFVQRMVKQHWMRQLIRQLRKVRYFVVLSNEDAAQWTELGNVKVIHNPLPFLPDQQSDGTQKQVIAVGRYMPQKGFDRLVSAWRIVSRKHPDWTLSIYGDGMREQLQRQVDEEGVASSCLLKHTVQNIVDKYCESSIFVLSSRYEGFGMVIIEAMACGVPPVSFTCPCGPRDIIADGRDGLLVENGDIEGLAEKICYLIEHEDLRRKMGRQARMDVERFRIEHIAEQWKELFEEALEKGGSDGTINK
jgi:glycosyltransferase involved in cell wall biosynthesis